MHSKDAAEATSSRQIIHAPQMIRLLGEQMGMGFWRLVMASNAVFWSDRVFEIYGLPKQLEPVDRATALSIFIPEDRDRAAEQISRTLIERKSRKYVLRADTPRGIRAIEFTVDIALEANGDVKELFGTILDITDRAAPDGNAVGRSFLLRALMKNIPAAIAIFDTEMNYLAVSDFWVSGHSAKSARDLIGKNHYVLRSDLSPEHKAEHRHVLAGETVKSPRSYTTDRHGHPIHQICVMCPWHTNEGKIGGMLMMLGTVDTETPPTGAAVTPTLPSKHELLDILKELV